MIKFPVSEILIGNEISLKDPRGRNKRSLNKGFTRSDVRFRM